MFNVATLIGALVLGAAGIWALQNALAGTAPTVAPAENVAQGYPPPSEPTFTPGPTLTVPPSPLAACNFSTIAATGSLPSVTLAQYAFGPSSIAYTGTETLDISQWIPNSTDLLVQRGTQTAIYAEALSVTTGAVTRYGETTLPPIWSADLGGVLYFPQVQDAGGQWTTQVMLASVSPSVLVSTQASQQVITDARGDNVLVRDGSQDVDQYEAQSTGLLVQTSINGPALAQTFPNGSTFSWQPNGPWVANYSDELGLVLWNEQTGVVCSTPIGPEKVRLGRFTGPGLMAPTYWSSDGRYVLTLDLNVLDVTTGAMQTVPNVLDNFGVSIAWSPVHRIALIYSSRRSATGVFERQFVLYDPASNSTRTMLADRPDLGVNNFDFTSVNPWSSDGTRLALQCPIVDAQQQVTSERICIVPITIN
jgi:hypothetical protein